jgi:four helix bundle protein
MFSLRGAGIGVCSSEGMSRDYNKLRVFHSADDLVVDVYTLTALLPIEERFGMQTQIRRAAVSAPTNIVEGSVRRSDKNYLRFLEISLGSACEARYLIGLAVRLGLLPAKECDPISERYTELIKGLAALITTIEAGLADRVRKRRRRLTQQPTNKPTADNAKS